VNNRLFFFPCYERYVLFTSAALVHMYRHVQKRIWDREAGGEIYAVDPDGHGLIVTTATGPNRKDSRTRCSFNPDIKAAEQDRERQFALGMHTVGLWHTHPEANPSPSSQDRQTAEEYLSAFQGGRRCYLLVIVGNYGNPPKIKVWAASHGAREMWFELIEESRGFVSSVGLSR
jgi:integrative and conjugative element protein (TIGR02256 family)